jgi:hypothetical protein
MPTTLRRAAVTLTPQVQHALEVAARRWPEAAGRPATLLANLAVDSAAQIESSESSSRSHRIPPLPCLSTGGRAITNEMVYEALADEY